MAMRKPTKSLKCQKTMTSLTNPGHFYAHKVSENDGDVSNGIENSTNEGGEIRSQVQRLF